MAQDLLLRAGSFIERRRFLAVAGSMTLGGLAFLLGGRASEAAYSWYCCSLCLPHDPGCASASCACFWWWFCCYNGSYTLGCGECYNSGGSCDTQCIGIKCSYGYEVSPGC